MLMAQQRRCGQIYSGYSDMHELINDLEIQDRDGAVRVCALLDQKRLLKNLVNPIVPVGLLQVKDFTGAIHLMVSEDGLDQEGQQFFDYFPEVYSRLITKFGFSLPPEIKQQRQAEARKIADAFSAETLTQAQAVLKTDGIHAMMLKQAAGDQSLVDEWSNIIANEIDAYVGSILKMCFLDHLENHPLLAVSLEILEAGTFPCGWISENSDRANYHGALCYLAVPTEEKTS